MYDFYDNNNITTIYYTRLYTILLEMSTKSIYYL